ncbi:hypothetical protein [Streptomyces sp. NPDC005907]|uniref:hypothetical protein n=1 Tax=Streptomyces sp. NPDC005907 TaxID=3154571 RepID=UPI0034067976
MKIIAAQVTGHVFVVAVDEVEALKSFNAGDTYDAEREAVEYETYRNRYDRHPSGDVMNTYRIDVTAEKVH